MMRFRLTVPVVNERWWDTSKRELSRLLLEDNQEAWREERDPQEQTKWAPRKPPTGTWPILRKTGRMQDTTRIRTPNTGIFTARTSAPYGRFHMTGTSRMVARPWLGIPAQSMPRMADVVGRNLFRRRTRTFR